MHDTRVCAALALVSSLALGACGLVVEPRYSRTRAPDDAMAIDGGNGSDGAVVSDGQSDAGRVCPEGLTACGDECVRLASDSNHCGACARRCEQTANATSSCVEGVCRSACATGFGDCDRNPANGCEASLRTTMNCGACGRACSGATPVCDASAGVCASSCDAGQTQCGMSCVQLASDPMNCGACGTACASPPNSRAGCSGGMCRSACVTGFADCDMNPANGCEVDIARAPANCGACGTVCPTLPGAAPQCTSGRCGFVCRAGAGDCDAIAANGCEAVLDSDARNCGACGNACPPRPNATPTCERGACGFTCLPGFADCDMNASNGCEAALNSPANCGGCGRPCAAGTVCDPMVGMCVSTCGATQVLCGASCVTPATDPANCGGCGMTCPALPNARPTCTASACGSTCNLGFGNCDAMLANGCETTLTMNPAHCGRCGVACPGGANGTARCVGGTCSLACSGGFGNCDGEPLNGCETATSSSVLHCGACGNVCPAGPNSAALCSSGTCQLRCAAGFGNCDGNLANGCETSLLTNNNCGMCARACMPGQRCAVDNPAAAACTGTMSVCLDLRDVLCGGRCVNIQSDPNNCGGCGVGCAAEQACVGGHCASCPAGFSLCLQAGQPPRCCNGGSRCFGACAILTEI